MPAGGEPIGPLFRPAAGALREGVGRGKRHFRNAIVRGDTDFDRSDFLQPVLIIDIGGVFRHQRARYANRAAVAPRIPRDDRKPFIPRAQGGRAAEPARQGVYRTTMPPMVRSLRSFVPRFLGSGSPRFSYQPGGLDSPCPMIARRIRIEEKKQSGGALRVLPLPPGAD